MLCKTSGLRDISTNDNKKLEKSIQEEDVVNYEEDLNDVVAYQSP